jgi:lipoprotein-anchoring transpeptidase ErfK/SrfK
MRKETKKYICALALLVGVAVGGCQQKAGNSEQAAGNSAAAQTENGATTDEMQPTLEVSPTEKADGGWLVAAADELKLTARAAGASEVKFNFSPVASADSDFYFEIAALNQPTDAASGAFVAEIKHPADFAGELWIEAVYADGSTRASEPVNVAARQIIGAIMGNEKIENERAGGEQNTGQNAENAQPITNEAVYITANVPSFRLTLWENGAAAKTYEIGVGKRSHPIPIGDRQASEVILNPAWIPPDSPWVRRMRGVNPYDRVTADDPRNPLGNIKIPLGNAYLIHEAAAPTDIGSLVSHGCIRMRTDDIFDLTARLSGARGLSLSNEEIERARKNTERKAAAFDPPLPVRISYDTAVIENNQLHLYPDVYERGTNTAEKLREFLRANNLENAQITDETLRGMWNKTSMKEKFTISLDDLRAGRALERGRTEPITSESAKPEKTASEKSGNRNSNKRN